MGEATHPFTRRGLAISAGLIASGATVAEFARRYLAMEEGPDVPPMQPSSPRRFRDRQEAADWFQMQMIEWVDGHVGKDLKNVGTPYQHKGMEYGGYMPEALNGSRANADASISHFHQVFPMGGRRFGEYEFQYENERPTLCRYPLYRSQIVEVYGVPLVDCNYFSMSNPPNRMPDILQIYIKLAMVAAWIIEASRYGEPTIGFELWGGAMTMLRNQWRGEYWTAFVQMAEYLEGRGFSFRLRFLSEANLSSSRFFNHNNQFHSAVLQARSTLPKSVKLVFSPSINSARTWEPLCRGASGPMPFDLIGGTLYANEETNLVRSYADYYRRAERIFPKVPFQICELGAPFAYSRQVKEYLTSCESRSYPALERINLFGNKLNRNSPSQRRLGPYGFRSGMSYLKEFFAG